MPPLFLVGELEGSPLRFELRPGRNVVGRSIGTDLHIPDATISRRHAELTLKDGRLTLRDLNSLNGTQVNGEDLDEETHLSSGDRICFGHACLRVAESPETPSLPKSELLRNAPAHLTSVLQPEAQLWGEGSGRLIGALSKAGRMLSRRMDSKELFEAVFDLLERFVPASRMVVLASSEAHPTGEIVALRNLKGGREDPLAMSESMARSLVLEGKTFVTRDAEADERWSAADSVRSLGIHAAMGAPLFDGDTIRGALYLDSRDQDTVYRQEDLDLLSLIASLAATKLHNIEREMAEEHLQEIEVETNLAAHIQSRLIPNPLALPEAPGLDIFAHLEACQEVGGDLYHLRKLNTGELWLALGDVTGKGIPAALLMAYVTSGLDFLSEHSLSPPQLVAQLDRQLCPKVASDQFVTLFCGLYDPQTGRLVYVNAGHHPPKVVTEDGILDLESTGMAIAMFPDAPEREMRSCFLDPQSTLFLFSDGVCEAESPDGLQFQEGPFQRCLEELGSRQSELSAKELGKRVLRDLDEHLSGEPPTDDLTLVILKREA
jgi:serine phosphatase RsbU (regulator of sigma subunit)